MIAEREQAGRNKLLYAIAAHPVAGSKAARANAARELGTLTLVEAAETVSVTAAFPAARDRVTATRSAQAVDLMEAARAAAVRVVRPAWVAVAEGAVVAEDAAR